MRFEEYQKYFSPNSIGRYDIAPIYAESEVFDHLIHDLLSPFIPEEIDKINVWANEYDIDISLGADDGKALSTYLGNLDEIADLDNQLDWVLPIGWPTPVEELELTLDSTIEIYSIQIEGIWYEVHVNSPEGDERSIKEIFSERGKVDDKKIRPILHNLIAKIE